MVKFNYDQEWDILYVHKNGEKVKFSIEALENFVIDIGMKGQVVGLEIQNASKVLKVPKSQLSEVRSAKISTFVRGRLYGVLYSLQLNKIKIESELQMPVDVRIKA